MTIDGSEMKAAKVDTLQRVKPGCEDFLESWVELTRGRRVGLIANHTSVFPDGRHDVDVLRGEHNVTITVLFSPEHGIRGTAPAGEHVDSLLDPLTGLQVFSLYGEHTKPDKSMLEDVDFLVYDIQDAATRFYTYISTMTLCMESAAENNIPFVVFDRPTIISGNKTDGPFLHEDCRSYIGMLPVPILYGMTPGELAGLIQKEYLKPKGLKAELKVIRLRNYNRTMWYDETGLPWVIPSPNVRTIEAATIYPGTALVEGTNVSEGRGTGFPFQTIGAPFIDGKKLADSLTGLDMPGVRFEPADFTPHQSNTVSHPRFKDQLCHGVFIRVTDRTAIRPVEVGLATVCAIRNLYPEDTKFRSDGAFDRLTGDRQIKTMIEEGAGFREIASTWKDALDRFTEVRKEYFLY